MIIKHIPLYDTIEKPFSITFKDQLDKQMRTLLENSKRSCLIGNISISEMDKDGERHITINFEPLPVIIEDRKQ